MRHFMHYIRKRWPFLDPCHSHELDKTLAELAIGIIARRDSRDLALSRQADGSKTFKYNQSWHVKNDFFINLTICGLNLLHCDKLS